MFVGGSGTGKTIAAEVLASEQQVDLYRVDLAALSQKWVGETEKNLSRSSPTPSAPTACSSSTRPTRCSAAAARCSEARDRWANLEVNYLLQRIEDYSGVVILATNLRQNIDDAFQRRIHVVVEFPVPDAASRAIAVEPPLARRGARWRSHRRTSTTSPCASSSPAATSAMSSSTRVSARSTPGRPNVSLRHLIASIAREYQKTARPVTQGDFGRHYDWAMQDVVAPADLGAAAIEG